jgi:GDPmannose 4,6-dehydratase
MSTALITGVTGQDGSYLAELLLGKGYRVFGTTRSEKRQSPFLPDGLQLRQLDLQNYEAVERLMRELAPDEVYHLAGQSSVGMSYRDPAGTFVSVACGTLHVLEALRVTKSPARTFVASSGEVFGDVGSERAHERTPFQPNGPYGVAKAAAASLVQSYRSAFGMHACVGLLFNHESPRRPPQFVTRKIVRAACEIALGRSEKLELGDLSVVRDWGWAPDYVDGFWRMLRLEQPEDFVLATGESHPLEQFVAEAFSSVGLRFRDHVISNAELFRPTETRSQRADPRRAAEKLGWRANTRLSDVVRRMVDAERNTLTSS